jgi:drug/metabolite transporter (DMT)-like permease
MSSEETAMDRARTAIAIAPAASWRWVLLAVPPLLWAGNVVAGRAVRDAVPPMTLAFARHLLAFLVLLPFAWPGLRADARTLWRHRGVIARTALAGMAGFNLLVYAALHTTTATNVLLLNAAIPVLIVLFGAVLGRGAPTRHQVAGMLLSCAGVLLIIGHGDPARIAQLRFARGDLLAFAAMGGFALYSLWLRDLPAGLDRIGVLATQLGVAAVGLLPFAAWEWVHGAHAHAHAGPAALGAVLYVALGASLLAPLLYMAGVARVGAARAGLFLHLMPVFGALLAALLLGEALHAYHALGIAVIAAGLGVSNRPPRSCTQAGDSSACWRNALR